MFLVLGSRSLKLGLEISVSVFFFSTGFGKNLFKCLLLTTINLELGRLEFGG